ncbi:Trk system potassium uptake protein TrkA [Caulifigura coniformis]|uniref:Trk system potassium uptake protein TrkA n=1 Tax=Caulifigura coniformis TaxID=2527983 RepID=A0A517S7N7_9PLAN|nr:TrkA family potassium uptake protein [Caulifigura coniformis]QDT52119.1 Trk system potassium uptake protein TrkA [Caulifigura coniformis]
MASRRQIVGLERSPQQGTPSSMYIIVVGCGSIGSRMIELAIADRHEVVLIEERADRAEAAARRYDARVLHANIAHGDILKEAGGDKADALIATTSDDSANLMTMFLGRQAGIRSLVTLVSQTDHVPLFERLGVQILTDPDVIVARHLYGFVRQPAIVEFVTLPGGGDLFEIVVAPGSPLVGKSLAEVGEAKLLPESTLILTVERGELLLPGRGATTLQAADHLRIYSQSTLKSDQLRVFTG